MLLYSNLLTDSSGIIVEGVGGAGGGGSYTPPPYIPPPPAPLPVLQPTPTTPTTQKPTCSTCGIPSPTQQPQVVTVQVAGAPGQAGAVTGAGGMTLAQMVSPENMGLLLLILALGLAAAAAYNEQRKGR